MANTKTYQAYAGMLVDEQLDIKSMIVILVLTKLSTKGQHKILEYIHEQNIHNDYYKDRVVLASN